MSRANSAIRNSGQHRYFVFVLAIAVDNSVEYRITCISASLGNISRKVYPNSIIINVYIFWVIVLLSLFGLQSVASVFLIRALRENHLWFNCLFRTGLQSTAINEKVFLIALWPLCVEVRH